MTKDNSLNTKLVAIFAFIFLALVAVEINTLKNEDLDDQDVIHERQPTRPAIACPKNQVLSSEIDSDGHASNACVKYEHKQKLAETTDKTQDDDPKVPIA